MKAALLAQVCPRRVLARLTKDGSQGRRELLLASSWLLARKPLLEQLWHRPACGWTTRCLVFECGTQVSAGLPAPLVQADGPEDLHHLQ